MTDDMRLIEDNNRLITILLDDINIVLPLVTADTHNGSGSLLAPPLKEAAQGVFISMSTAPDEPSPLQIIDIGVVGMASLEADLIYANKPYMSIVFPLSAIGNCHIHCAPYGVPRDIEELAHLFPGQQTSPKGKNCDEGQTAGFFAHTPGDILHLNPMFRTPDTSERVIEKDSNTPKGDVLHRLSLSLSLG